MRPQGRRGEVLADLLTDFPEKFAERKQLRLGLEGAADPREYSLESHWLHKNRVVLKFKGVESISDAEALTGMLVQIPSQARAPLEGGAVYISDLVGSIVIDRSQNRKIGTISEVQQETGAAPLLVVRELAKQYEIPFAEEFIVRFDASQKVLELKLPAGMLEVNAPLSQEEKQWRGSKKP